MTTLHLGVLDIPHMAENKPRKIGKPKKGVRKGNRSRKTGPAGTQNTTGDVAERLEDKYHVMQVFFNQREADVAKTLETSIGGALENLMGGAPVSTEPFAEGMGEIETIFKNMLDIKAFDGLIPGAPTAASLKGINHRLKHPYSKSNPVRPSFIDTGEYQATFKAWVDG